MPALVVMVKAGRGRILERPSMWAFVGGSLFGVHQLLFFESLKLTTVANVTIIGALQPAMVALVSYPLFGERVRAAQVIWIVTAIGGVSLVVAGSVGSPAWSGWGDFLAFLNIVAFTAYFLASKQARKTMDTARYNMWMTATAGVIVAAVCLVTTQPLMRYDAREWLVVAVIALIPGTLGHFAVNWAHPRVPAAVSSMILLGLPILSAFAAWITLGESLTLVAIIGCGITIASIAAMVMAGQARGPIDELELESTAT